MFGVELKASSYFSSIGSRRTTKIVVGEERRREEKDAGVAALFGAASGG